MQKPMTADPDKLLKCSTCNRVFLVGAMQLFTPKHSCDAVALRRSGKSGLVQRRVARKWELKAKLAAFVSRLNVPSTLSQS